MFHSQRAQRSPSQGAKRADNVRPEGPAPDWNNGRFIAKGQSGPRPSCNKRYSYMVPPSIPR